MAVSTATAVDRDALLAELAKLTEVRNEWLRRQILENNRIDILAKEVLGYEVKPFHIKMQRHLMMHKESLHLVFRGAGKTTTLTVCKAIIRILQNRNVRILIASKTQGFATDILREIKAHFEENPKVREVFGDYVGDSWNESEITVSGRTKPAKEPTVATVGVNGQTVGYHFDMVLGDDLVDEDNSRTPYMRDRVKTWYYKVLTPTFEPQCEVHIIGTRYHFDDLYGHLSANELKTSTMVIPALDIQGRTPWPARYKASGFEELRKRMGIIIFNSQYQCDTEAMKGEIFQYDDCQQIKSDDCPWSELVYFAGFDLAIKEKEQADRFAAVGIGVHPKLQNIYVVASWAGHIGFTKQTAKIREWWRTGFDGVVDPKKIIRFAIETNAYQDAQYQKLKEEERGMLLRPVVTLKDKVTRAWKLSPRFENKHVYFVGHHVELIEELVLMPAGRHDDLFDALELAVTTAFQSRDRKRAQEFGLL